MNRTTGYLDGIRVGTMHSSINFRFGCKVNSSRVDFPPHVKILSVKVNALLLGKVFKL